MKAEYLVFPIVTGAAFLWLTPSRGVDDIVKPQTHAEWREPYGGCKEASGYPNSRGYKQCKRHGRI
jgi:hypothetical protein